MSSARLRSHRVKEARRDARCVFMKKLKVSLCHLPANNNEETGLPYLKMLELPRWFPCAPINVIFNNTQRVQLSELSIYTDLLNINWEKVNRNKCLEKVELHHLRVKGSFLVFAFAPPSILRNSFRVLRNIWITLALFCIIHRV